METIFHTGLQLQFTQATFSEYYFCRSQITNFARSDFLIMTLNSHSLIKKIRLAQASNNSRSLSLALRSTLCLYCMYIIVISTCM